MKAIVIGAGFGGLAAAVQLASNGHEVVVFEAQSHVGGKAGSIEVDGIRVETGPSVMTLPHIAEAVLRTAGERWVHEVSWRTHETMLELRFPNASAIRIPPGLEPSTAAIGEALGSRAASEYRSFLLASKKIWETAAPRFVMGPAPGMKQIWRMAPAMLRDWRVIDPLRSMSSAIDASVKTPELRSLFARFATYNGSDPRKAPATLNCIAWVELGLGGFGVDGGFGALVSALRRAAESHGARFELQAPVEHLELSRGVVRGVTVGGKSHAADVVVCNADVLHLVSDLLPSGSRTGLPEPSVPSLSGYTMVLRGRAGEARCPHTVIFPANYDEEIGDLHDRGSVPQDPTVTVCDQVAAHNLDGWEDGTVPLFAIANAPALVGMPAPTDGLRSSMLAKLTDAGFIAGPEDLRWEESPSDLAGRFPGSRGSLYGGASNSRFAAFQRPPNRVPKVAGLYLASGSAHPGGGVPLCLQSGVAAARAIAEGR